MTTHYNFRQRNWAAGVHGPRALPDLPGAIVLRLQETWKLGRLGVQRGQSGRLTLTFTTGYIENFISTSKR